MSLPLMDDDVVWVEDIKAESRRSSSAGDSVKTAKRSPLKQQTAETQYDADCEMVEVANKVHTIPSTVSNEDDVSTALAPCNRPTTDSKGSRHSLKWNLRVIISNLYMKTEQRLPSARLPKCLHNTSLCVSKHRCAMLPDAPSIGLAQELRNNLNNQHYDTYLDMLEIMALQCVYPDESGFDRLFDLMMILSTKSMAIEELSNIYVNVVRTFYLLLDTFPPCWTALRPYYLNFLGVNKTSKVKSQKLPLLLDLLEKCISECSDTEITELTPFCEDFKFNYAEEESGALCEAEVFLRHVDDYDWEGDKDWTHGFKTMSAPVRLARLTDALNLLCWILEREFLSWLDHNRMVQEESEIYLDESQPFVLIVFGMTPNNRLTTITRQLLRLYSRAAAKSMHPLRLNILQRFVCLIMEVSNTAELHYIDHALMFPRLGTQTRNLIGEFFKIFKTENPTHISIYLKTIEQLQQPYVRSQFTDHFLQLFYWSSSPFGPEKVCEQLKAKQWLKYKPRSEIEDDDDEQLAREDYLRIMLNALRDYCNWLNVQACWLYMKTKDPVQQLQTSSTSSLATPVGVITGNVGKIFMLDAMQKEAHTWSKRINRKVILTKPKVNLPVARVNAGQMAELYGNDIRQLRYLRRVLRVAMRYVDVTNWLAYMDDFLGEDLPPTVN